MTFGAAAQRAQHASRRAKHLPPPRSDGDSASRGCSLRLACQGPRGLIAPPVPYPEQSTPSPARARRSVGRRVACCLRLYVALGFRFCLSAAGRGDRGQGLPRCEAAQAGGVPRGRPGSRPARRRSGQTAVNTTRVAARPSTLRPPRCARERSDATVALRGAACIAGRPCAGRDHWGSLPGASPPPTRGLRQCNRPEGANHARCSPHTGRTNAAAARAGLQAGQRVEWPAWPRHPTPKAPRAPNRVVAAPVSCLWARPGRPFVPQRCTAGRSPAAVVI
jgi:hypothetical protein